MGKKKIDEALLEDLEMLLIGADIGIQTTDKVIESVRKKASRKELKDSDGLYELIKIELESFLITENLLQTNVDKTFVILVSSQKIISQVFSTSIARSVMSCKLPIGVETT